MSIDDTGAPSGAFCSHCGTRNRVGARFCHACGTPLAVPQEPPVTEPPPPFEATHGAPAPAEPLTMGAYAAPTGKRAGPPLPAIIAGGVIAAAIASGAAWYLLSGQGGTLTKAYATEKVEVKSARDAAGASGVGDVNRGDVISGVWEPAKPGQPRWFRTKLGGQEGWIAGTELSSRPRPTLVSTDLGDQTATVGSLVYREPDTAAGVVDNLAAGESTPVTGATGDGWMEVKLASGGVGYVKADTFQADPSPGRTAAPMPGVTHYQCAFAPEASVDPPSDPGALDFILDESRACIGHRYAYVPAADGALERVMLNDRAHQVSRLAFSADRRSFQRTDYSLPPDAYDRVLKSSAALETMVCAPPGDSEATRAVQSAISLARPSGDLQPLATHWTRRVWRCAPTG